MPGAPNQTPAFFHFVDRKGQDHVVDNLEDVPAEYRNQVLRLSLKPVPTASAPPVMPSRDLLQDPPLDAWHAPSFGLGALAMMLAMVVVQLVRGTAGRLIVRTVLMGLLVTGLGVAWITVLQDKVRQGAGLPPSMSPTQVLDDAKRATETLNQQTRANNRALQQLDP